MFHPDHFSLNERCSSEICAQPEKVFHEKKMPIVKGVSTVRLFELPGMGESTDWSPRFNIQDLKWLKTNKTKKSAKKGGWWVTMISRRNHPLPPVEAVSGWYSWEQLEPYCDQETLDGTTHLLPAASKFKTRLRPIQSPCLCCVNDQIDWSSIEDGCIEEDGKVIANITWKPTIQSVVKEEDLSDQQVLAQFRHEDFQLFAVQYPVSRMVCVQTVAQSEGWSKALTHLAMKEALYSCRQEPKTPEANLKKRKLEPRLLVPTGVSHRYEEKVHSMTDHKILANELFGNLIDRLRTKSHGAIAYLEGSDANTTQLLQARLGRHVLRYVINQDPAVVQRIVARTKGVLVYTGTATEFIAMMPPRSLDVFWLDYCGTYLKHRGDIQALFERGVVKEHCGLALTFSSRNHGGFEPRDTEALIQDEAARHGYTVVSSHRYKYNQMNYMDFEFRM